MRKNAIKAVLFSLSSLVAPFAHAELPADFRLVDELPIEQRVVAHQEVLKFLNLHPDMAADAKVIAVDGGGTVYVLDEKLEKIASVGAPSTFREQ